MAVILTAVIQTQKDIVQFNLNTKRLALNPFCSVEKPSWLCSYHHISPGFKTVLTILSSRPRNTSIYVCGESQHLIQVLRPWRPAILNQAASWPLIWKSVQYLLTSSHLNLKMQSIWDHSWVLRETQQLNLQRSQARLITGFRQWYLFVFYWLWITLQPCSFFFFFQLCSLLPLKERRPLWSFLITNHI